MTEFFSFFFLKRETSVWSTVHKWFAEKEDRHKILTYCKTTGLKNAVRNPKPTVSQQTSSADVAGGLQSTSFLHLEKKGLNLATKRG